MARARNWASASRRRRAHQLGTIPATWGAKVARRTVTKPPKDTYAISYDEVARRLIAR